MQLIRSQASMRTGKVFLDGTKVGKIDDINKLNLY